MRVLVTGASGFVGGHLITRLLSDGHEVVGLSRTPRSSARTCLSWARGDVASGDGLADAAAGVDAVVHLVGVIRETRQLTFEAVHVDGTRNVLSAAREAGVKRFVHMSAVGADPASASGYRSSKGRAEALVRDSDLAWTILRPDMILGVGDGFFSGTLRDLVTKAPVVPVVGSGAYPLRPISVHDVTTAFARALGDPATHGLTFDLVGPREYTLRELQVLVRDTLGVRKPLVHVPLPLMRLGVRLFRMLPDPPITRDELTMLLTTVPSDPAPAVEAFGLQLRTVEEELPAVIRAAPAAP